MQVRQQKGFGMIEVLVAAIVLLLGILSLVRLQAVTLSTLSNTNQHYVAASLANDMGERIRANAKQADLYVGKNTASMVSCQNFSSCNLQEQDLWLWAEALSDASQALPDAKGNIRRQGSHLIVTITWSEKAMFQASVTQGYALEVAYQ